MFTKSNKYASKFHGRKLCQTAILIDGHISSFFYLWNNIKVSIGLTRIMKYNVDIDPGNDPSAVSCNWCNETYFYWWAHLAVWRERVFSPVLITVSSYACFESEMLILFDFSFKEYTQVYDIRIIWCGFALNVMHWLHVLVLFLLTSIDQLTLR